MAATQKEEKPKRLPTPKYYMRLGGVEGPRSGPRPGWFSISSFQWGMGMGVSSGGRRRRNNNDADAKPPARECSQPSVSEITISRDQDVHSSFLMARTLGRLPYPTVELEGVDPDGYLLWNTVLDEVYVSGFSASTDGGGTQESISLNFESCKISTASLHRRNIKIPSKFPSPKEEDWKAVQHVPFARTREILLHIFAYLEPHQLMNVALTCKNFLRVANTPSLNVIEKHSASYNLEDNTTRIDGDIVIADETYLVKPPTEDDN